MNAASKLHLCTKKWQGEREKTHQKCVLYRNERTEMNISIWQTPLPPLYILICNSDVDSSFLCSPLIIKKKGGVKAWMLYVSYVYAEAMPSPVDDPLHESHYKPSNLDGLRLIPIWLYKVKQRA